MEKFVIKFNEVLVAARAPVLVELDKSSFKEQALLGLLGGARIGTLKKRVRMAEKMMRWLSVTKGCAWPRSPADALDYLYSGIAEYPRVTFPRELSAMLSWFEARLGFSDMEMILPS